VLEAAAIPEMAGIPSEREGVRDLAARVRDGLGGHLNTPIRE
jgi:hypothetical protein